jgi:hypothetical protein
MRQTDSIQTGMQREGSLLPAPAASGSRPLKNPKWEALAREYASGESQAGAWRVVFGREPSTGNASSTFRREAIQARVEYLRGEFVKMSGVSLAALQARLLTLADANICDFFVAESSGTSTRLKLRDLTKLPRAVTAPITELQIDEDGKLKLKTADKLHALECLIKTVGGFVPEKEENRGVTLEDLVLGSMNRETQTHITMEVVTGARSPDVAAATDVSERSDRPMPKATIWA